MLNPAGTFLPESIEPSDQPNPVLDINDTEETALEKMVEYSPSLGGLRESIRTALLQVKFQENQMLPQVNLGAQFGVTATTGTTPCVSLNPTVAGNGNCTVANVPPAPGNGSKLPFGGIYGDALNQMLDARFYNYAAVLNFEMPLDNAAAKAALAQARVSYEQSRMQYRSALSESVLAIESALANYHADVKRAQATDEAVFLRRTIVARRTGALSRRHGDDARSAAIPERTGNRAGQPGLGRYRPRELADRIVAFGRHADAGVQYRLSRFRIRTFPPGTRSSSALRCVRLSRWEIPDGIPMGGDWRRTRQHGALWMQRTDRAVDRQRLPLGTLVVNVSGAL